MSLPILKRPRVNQDLLQHFEHIASDKLDPALRFLEVTETAFERLAENPRIGKFWKSPRTRLRDVRFYPIPSGFRNYLIFYQVTKDAVEILAVIHGAMDLESQVIGIDI